MGNIPLGAAGIKKDTHNLPRVTGVTGVAGNYSLLGTLGTLVILDTLVILGQ